MSYCKDHIEISGFFIQYLFGQTVDNNCSRVGLGADKVLRSVASRTAVSRYIASAIETNTDLVSKSK